MRSELTIKTSECHKNQTLSLQKNCFIWFNENPLKMMKNTFYFILKAFFVLTNKKICVLTFSSSKKTGLIGKKRLRYYATFRVRKFDLLFYKINTFEKNYHLHWIAGKANILSKNLKYIYFQFWEWLLRFLF